MARVWLGSASHFCLAHRCQFHLATLICDGSLVVSTVGELRSVLGRGPMESLGADPGALYETMVFRCDGLEECGCCARIMDLTVLDGRRYETARAAQAGHMAMLEKWEAADGSR